MLLTLPMYLYQIKRNSAYLIMSMLLKVSYGSFQELVRIARKNSTNQTASASMELGKYIFEQDVHKPNRELSKCYPILIQIRKISLLNKLVHHVPFFVGTFHFSPVFLIHFNGSRNKIVVDRHWNISVQK